MKRAARLLVAIALAIAIYFGARREGRLATEARALRVVTALDVVTLRLDPPAGTPGGPQGVYRMRSGGGVVVLTVNHAPPGTRAVAWTRRADRWTKLGAFEPDAEGQALLTSEDDALAAPPDEVRVTRESRDANATDLTRGPSDQTIVSWVRPR